MDISTSKATKDDWGKVGRNEQCPCGSGKKFKKCCRLSKQPDAIRLRCTVTEIHETGIVINHNTAKEPISMSYMRLASLGYKVPEGGYVIGDEFDFYFSINRKQNG